jgi:phage terminase large subunit-like protein
MVLDNGEYWQLEDFQALIVDDVFSGVPEVWAVIPEGNAKALDVSTPLPTPSGWTTMGDVKVGDLLVGSDGNPARVTATSAVMTDRPCYRVRFSDGAEIVADADHLWSVQGAHDKYRPRVLTTAALLRAGVKMNSGAYRWRVPCATVQGTPAALPVPPYTFGAWLGDGDSAGGRVTNIDDGVWEAIRADGFDLGVPPPSARTTTQTVFGLQALLRAAGVLKNKHIPSVYFRASVEDRLALLRGLMDTDGAISSAGQATFATSAPRLREDVRRLVWSLGMPAHLSEGRARIYDKDCGPTWRITVSCSANDPIFGLRRKAERLKHGAPASKFRRISTIEPVDSRPVKCVQVDTPDHLYLASEACIPTHNTTLMGGVGLYHADFTPSANCLVAAASRDQAGILFGQAAGLVDRSPGFQQRFRVFEGYRRIVAHRTNGRLQVMAADERTGDGAIPSLGILDELHRHRDLRLLRTWVGKLNKRDGQILGISTAGEPGSEFEAVREKMHAEAAESVTVGCHTRSASDLAVIHDWRLPDGADPDDLKLVKQVNPLSTVTVTGLRRKRASPSMMPAHWRRFTCNQATRGEDSAINAQEWAAATTDMRPEPGTPVWVGVDLGWMWDTTAIVPLWTPTPDVRVLLDPVILTPPRDGTSTSPTAVQNGFLEIHERTPIHTVVMDRAAGGEQLAEWIENTLGARVIGHSNGNQAQALAAQRFYEGLRAAPAPTLRHTGDAELTRHILNARARVLPRGDVIFDRPSQTRSAAGQDSRVIDGLSASQIVHSVAVGEAGEPQRAFDPSDYRIERL